MTYSESIDFNGAETQASAYDPIPSGTLAKVRLTIRPGGAGPEGWVTQSRSSASMYLNTEAVVLEGPHARRRVFTRIGIKGKSVNEKGEDTYANRGRALIRGILESARGVTADDQSDRARAARTIRSYADLNGVEFIAKIMVEKDRDNPQAEPRNVIGAAVGPGHKDFAALMGAVPAVTTTSAGAPSWASPPSAAPQPAADGNAPFWAR